MAAQGLAAGGVAVFLLVRGLGSAPGTTVASVQLGEAGYFAVIGAALLAVAIGLARGRRWARTPAIVTQLLLLPVVYSLLGPSRQLLLGGAALLVVGSAFLLLLSEPVRRWWMAD